MPISQNHGCLGRIFKKMSKTLKIFAGASFYQMYVLPFMQSHPIHQTSVEKICFELHR